MQFLYLGISLAGCALLMKWSLDKMDPTKANKKAAAGKKAMLYRRLGRAVDMNSQEELIACEAINPEDINTSLSDIGGLEETKKALRHKVILPLTMPGVFSGFLLRHAKGVLLYGPPGTGKTMTAKALAKEAGANFITLRASTLQSKWFGETQKLTCAVFTLAYKLQPCIIFIDEVEAILGKRRELDHEAVSSMKTEFMQLWDGFNTDPTANVVVLGATNRPFDLDEAVLRRFALQLEVGLPDQRQREAILKLILKQAVTESSRIQGALQVDATLASNSPMSNGHRPLALIAEQTEGYSGSDLMDLCTRAAMSSVQDSLSPEQAQESGDSSSCTRQQLPIRILRLQNFIEALKACKPSTRQAEAYRAQMAGRNGDQQPAFAEAQQLMMEYLSNIVRNGSQNAL